MESDEFQKGVEDLLELAANARMAVMCAEALWWRCHRSLIADYLKARATQLFTSSMRRRPKSIHSLQRRGSLMENCLTEDCLTQ